MPRPFKALRLGALAAAGVLGAMGCTMLGTTFGGPAADPGGCNPQVPASYRILSEVPVGTLEIRVTQPSGSPLASASVTATRLVATGLRCPSTIEATTDGEGRVRFERMKTGPYDVRLGDQSATASAEVEADKTTSVTLRTP